MSTSTTFAAQALVKQNVTYLDITAAALLVYDYLLTVEREARLVWPVPMNVGKMLFLLTRYPVFADTFMVLYHQFAILDPETCTSLYRAIGFLLGVGTLIAETILAVRTWVIWHRDRRIAIILASALVLFWTPVFYFLRVALYSLVFTTPPQPDMPGCFLLKQNPILWVVFIFVMVFETLILALTLLKGLEHFRGTNNTLVTVLYRDGIMNYIYLCMLSIINVVVLLTAPHGYSTLLTAFQRAMHSILSARILLHLREAAVLRKKVSGAYQTSSMGGFTVDRDHPRTGVSFSFKKGNKKTGYSGGSGTGAGTGGAGGESVGYGGDESMGYGDESYISTTGGGDVGYEDVAAVVAAELAGPEHIFGEKEEGKKPETVTWFGDVRRGPGLGESTLELGGR